MGVNYNFIRELEGFSLSGYVPADRKGGVESGTTIATGVDLGQQSANGLRALKLPAPLLLKLAHYLGKTGEEARALLTALPLKLTELEARQLDECLFVGMLSALKRKFNTATSTLTWARLPDELQTVIFSVAYQYGNLSFRTPRFWQQITNGLWYQAYDNLLNFGDDYANRRLKEATLWQRGLDKLNKEEF